MEYKVFGALIIIVSVAALLFFVGNTISQDPEIGTYVGKLEKGISVLPFGGEPTVEIIFEDGRKFTAPEQMAKDVDMKVGNTYRITFDISAPNVALEIREWM